MSYPVGEIKLRWRDQDLTAQYQELIRLREEIARLLNPPKNSPARKRRIAARRRSGGPIERRDERLAVGKPILLLIPGR